MLSTSTFVVLTDVSDSTQHLLLAAAALAEPLGARLVLLHVYHDLILEPEMVPVAAAYTNRNRAALREQLEKWSADLPVPTEIEVSSDSLAAAIDEIGARLRPVAFVMGISSPENWFDRLLSNAALPILRSAFYPLILIPTGASRRRPTAPHHALIAVDADPIHLTPAALMARRRLLDGWQAISRVLHVEPLTDDARSAAPAAAAFEAVRTGLALPALRTNAFHVVTADDIAPAILRAAEVEADAVDLLVLIARPRSFLSELFHRSVTAQVARHSTVPVLLLPTRG